MASTVFARGAEWSAALLYDGWGEGVTDERAKALGDLVIERFDELAREAGSTCFWQPATSEVMGEVYGQDTDDHSKWDEKRDDGGHTTPELLARWREQAQAEVWGAVIGESNNPDVYAEVTAILES